MKKKRIEQNRRVLVAAPTNERHDYVINEWLESLDKQSYQNFDIMLICTDENKYYYEKLYELSRTITNLRVYWVPWEPKKLNILQHLAICREFYRHLAYVERYDYLFNLDTDIIIPNNGIEELIAANKDQVGYVVHVFPKGEFQPPCVFSKAGFSMNQINKNSNGLHYYSWSWVSRYRNQLRKVYATGLGVLMVKRKVFAKAQFRTHPTFINGEDLWYYAEAHDKGFESWCLVKRVTHKNTSWGGVVSKSKRRMRLTLALGPEKGAKQIVVCKGHRGRRNKNANK